MTERLAAALALLLDVDTRDRLRKAKVPAREVVRMFSFDHIVLHTWEGSDKWHNLHPMLRTYHVIKSRGDTTRAAKVVRLDDKWRGFMRAVEKGKKPKPKPQRWGRR